METDETYPANHRAVTSQRVAVWLAGFLLLCFAYFSARLDPGVIPRLDMTLAIVNHGTVAVDVYHDDREDDVLYHGHYYSSKAPGQSLLGVPVYLAFKAVRSALGQPPVDNPDDPIVRSLVAGYTVAVPSVLFLLLFFWFLGYFTTSILSRAVLTLAVGIATVIYPYSQTVYSHVPAAGLLFAGFVLVYLLTERGAGARAPWLAGHPQVAALLAGFCLAAAVLFEYPAASVSILIAGYAILRLRPSLWPYLVAGAVPVVIAVMLYNFAAFHDVLALDYRRYAVVYKQDAEGLGGISWPPKQGAFYGLTFSPFRGLFFLSPFLVLAFPGYLLWARRREYVWLLCVIIPVVTFLLTSMYWNWTGGWAVGPRYLIPMVPFLALPVIFVLDRATTWPARFGIAALLTASFANVWAQTISRPFSGYLYWPDYSPNPLFTLSLPALARGQVAPNDGMVLGLSGIASLIPLIVALTVWSVIVFMPPILARAPARPAHVG